MTNSRSYEFSPGDILVVGTDKRLHKAKLTTRERKRQELYGTIVTGKYLLLTYRDGDTVRQKYLGKLA